MRKRIAKLLACGVMASALLINGVSVMAADTSIDVPGDTATGETPTKFDVTTDILGGDLSVTVPAELILTYDSGSGKFTNQANVTAKGRISASKKLNVTAPTTVAYKNDDDNAITVDGAITFGTGGTETWSAAQLLTSLTTPDARAIKADVDLADISYIGTYKATVTYHLELVNK